MVKTLRIQYNDKTLQKITAVDRIIEHKEMRQEMKNEKIPNIKDGSQEE